MFDHPTLESIADFLSLETEEADLPGEYSTDDEATSEAHKRLWDLHWEVKQEMTDELFVPPAAKCARRAVILSAFAGSGSKQILSSLSSHRQLCGCKDLCLVPFKTVLERNAVLSSRRNNLQDGLIYAVETLRNCKISDMSYLFGTVANTYRALQEWCAPRILVDGTEAYSAVPEWSLVEAKNVFLDPDIVHLLRNPRACLGDARGSGDIVKLEKSWIKFTKKMTEFGVQNSNSLL